MTTAVYRFMPRVRSLGPYVLIELLLPGGTLLALLLWLSQGMARTGLIAIDQPVMSPSTIERVIAPTNHMTVGARP
ncbi:MAG TPA: hypothetical protein VFB75_23510 [Burkholderiales bacterium]|nr:hypothetical protein [Burkholderiales bacterium]